MGDAFDALYNYHQVFHNSSIISFSKSDTGHYPSQSHPPLGGDSEGKKD